MQQLNKNMPDFVKQDMYKLCNDFIDIFPLKTDTITTNNFYQQKLKLIDQKPIYVKNYRTPHMQKPEIERQVTKMLKAKS